MEEESTPIEQNAHQCRVPHCNEIEAFCWGGRFEITTILSPFRNEGVKIYQAYDHLCQKVIDLKIGIHTSAKSLLFNEFKVLSMISGIFETNRGVPGVLFEGVDNNGHRLLALEPLGPSLREYSSLYSEMKHRRVAVSRIMKLGINLLHTIRDLHSLGFVHGFICPSTISCKRGDPEKAWLTSFYYAREYNGLQSAAIQNELRVVVGRTRTKFSSFAVQTGQIYGPRDDLESLGYVLVFLLQGSLPWYEVSEEFTEDTMVSCLDVAAKMVSLNFLDKDVSVWMAEYLRYLRKLEHDRRPCYNFLESCLYKILSHAQSNVSV